MAKRIEINSDLTVGTDQPSRDDLRSLAEAGFNSVVDLRTRSEGSNALAPADEGAKAERAGMRYVNIEVDGACVEPAQLDSFRHQVAALPKPIFVHCASGKRSGSFALVEAAIREGLSGEEMLRRADSLGVAHGSDDVRGIYREYIDLHLRHPPRESGGTLPPTTRRVEEHSPEKLNRRVVAEIERSVRACADHPERIDARLKELDREWDMERTLEANAATLALVGTCLARSSVPGS